MKPLEKHIQAAILDYLALARILAWRSNSGAMRVEKRFVRFSTAKGLSDITGVLPDGRYLAIECKRPGGKATEQQRGFLSAIQAQGGLALVADSVECVRCSLRAEGYEVP